MPDTLPLRCACSTVVGRVTEAAGLPRIVCHCRGCQGYARWLEASEAILDDAGGTDIFQLTPAQLHIAQGADQLRSVRLTDKGAVRWFTACCRTPVANTLATARVPWLGLHHRFLDEDALGVDSRSNTLGPVRYRIHVRSARRPVPGGHPTGPLGLILNTVVGILWDTVRGRARPTPFFDDAGALVSEPASITEAERDALGMLG